jgi:hypothetical protein
MIGPDFDLNGATTFSLDLEVKKETNNKNLFVDLRDGNNTLRRFSLETTTGAHSIAGAGSTSSVVDAGDRWIVKADWDLTGLVDSFNFVLLPDFGTGEDSNVLFTWDPFAERATSVTRNLVTTIDATNFAVISGTTATYGTGSNPATGTMIIRNDQSQYLEVGNLRYYDVRVEYDEDDAVTFEVPGAAFVTNMQLNASIDGGTSWQCPGITILPVTGTPNRFTINRDDDVDSDCNVQLSFIAHMS